MWFGYGPIVDAEYALDNVSQFGWHRQWASSAAVSAALVLVLLNGCAERRGEIGRRAREENAAPGWACLNDDQAMGSRERLDLCKVSRIGAMGSGVLVSRHIATLSRKLVRLDAVCCQALERRLGSDSDCHFKALVLRNGAHSPCLVQRAALAATNC
jgi:hypothetical protein